MSGQGYCLPAPIGYYVDEIGQEAPQSCPGDGSNEGLGNENYWSCRGSDYDGDGISDNIDQYPFLSRNIEPTNLSLTWLSVATVAVLGINKLKISGHRNSEGE